VKRKEINKRLRRLARSANRAHDQTLGLVVCGRWDDPVDFLADLRAGISSGTLYGVSPLRAAYPASQALAAIKSIKATT